MRNGNSRKFYFMFLLYGLCTLVYYFGELVDFAGWEALRWNFFYTVHDVHRLFFLVPIIYAGYVFGIRASIIMTIIVAGTFLPRALFVSQYPDPLLRAMLFILFAGVMGYLTAFSRRESKRVGHLQAMLRSETEKLSAILDGIDEGAIIIGPDYRIRYMSPGMIRDFGEGTGSYCYEHLGGLDAPCGQICKLSDIISGAAEAGEYTFSDGRTYRLLASPFVDSDGAVCQLTIFKDIKHYKKL